MRRLDEAGASRPIRPSLRRYRKGLALLLVPTVILVGSLSFRRAGPQPNSADQVIFWANCTDTTKLSDSELDDWVSRGIDGFVCAHQHLFGLGGTQQFDRNPNAALTGESFTLQRSLRDSRVVERARSKGLKMYLGFYLVNPHNTATPLLDWFDDAGWNQKVLTVIRDIVGAAETLGFDGISFDQELYSADEAAQTWPWDYPGNTRSESEVRSKVQERGRQIMEAMLKVFPRLDLLTYAYNFAGDWKSVVQKEFNNLEDFGKSSTFIDWYDGLSSVEGYSAIRLFSTAFYKIHAPAHDWETALTHEYNSIYSVLSRGLSNWSYAASRIHLSPSIWIDNGDSTSPDAYDSARSPEEVDRQLQQMQKWAAGREFVIFAYHSLYGTSAGKYQDAFDYGPYVPAIKRASTPGVIDSGLPSLSLTAPSSGTTFHTPGEEIELRGVAGDNMALRVVRWKNDRGGGGAAQMDWQVRCGDHRTGYEWQLAWTVGDIRLQPGTNKITVTAEDIKGLHVTREITVVAGSSTPSPDDTDPTVRLSSPTCNSVVSGRVVVRAEAADNAAVAKVEFLLDGVVTSTASAPPYTWEWDASVTGGGTRTLTAKAYDRVGRTASASIPVTVQGPPAEFTLSRAATPPVIDGDVTEYASASAAVFGRPTTTNAVTVRALWDTDNLYLAYEVQDDDLSASEAGRDENLWEQDSVEWFVDLRGDGGGSGAPTSPYMLADDHQGIVSVANVQFDARGTSSGTPDPSWNGAWTSHVATRASLDAGTDGSAGYVVESRIPWASLGLNGGPQENSTIGLSFAVNDKDVSDTSSVMWPDIVTGFQNAGKWQQVKVVGTS